MPRRFLAFRSLLIVGVSLFLGSVSLGRVEAQDDDSAVHVVVNMVQLNVAVTDKKGDYATGLRPEDFVITEDGITEKIATFAEGDMPARDMQAYDPNSSPEHGPGQGNDAPATLQSLVAGANVFVLFDSSNYMYRDFVFAEDAIAEFIRSLETADKSLSILTAAIFCGPRPSPPTACWFCAACVRLWPGIPPLFTMHCCSQ